MNNKNRGAVASFLHRGAKAPLLRRRDFFCAACVVMILAGCQALPRESPPVDAADVEAAWAQRKAALAAVERWQLQGRIAVSTQGRGWNGAVHWEQDGIENRIQLNAPLGAGSLRIEGTPQFMHIQATDGTNLLSTDPANDLAHWLGAPLPVGSLRWWALGLPDPNSPAPVELDTGGRLLAFEQDGWQVRYPRYTEHDSLILPGMIVAERGESKMRMIIDHWEAVPDAD